MDDLVKRLRDPLIQEGKAPWKLRLEAADTIEELREALRLVGKTVARAIADIQSELPKE